MAEGARLESVYTVTYRGFDSLSHRQIKAKGISILLVPFVVSGQNLRFPVRLCPCQTPSFFPSFTSVMRFYEFSNYLPILGIQGVGNCLNRTA